ncbi:NAD-dependent succinate-semialdehyde dehydrogenase [Actinobacteria bacterium YIM 96077]|uniref:NAD-dependent succinate-semialdehyde dehydrogenase n=1 Tax=Phytoactinopolyspora halophila TaxID=1981511 RepID=A0A329R092_9ACTN|nr:NAD-dependent succinate-semialdehyde dehydrogenase [Phytoactinopolyspora halophila]AYY11631.1 NAD-dependent succinate-semialdehyde dehydrogenase [Actinobacteria bacterium YIM 96077]RAW17937.1 NAD-dependent succinate-semialdehyde dehydrogenase [Phytoactinopolyspora halophila]
MSEREQAVVSNVSTGLFIGGKWRESASGARFDVEDPATEKTLTSVADATPDDGDAALAAAVGAQASWAATPPRTRGEILRGAYETIMARIDDLALLMTLEMGKSLQESRAEITYAADFFRWFAEEAVRISGRYSTSPAGGSRVLTMQQPVGPCLFITPWNFPMAMGTRKIGPAVAAGCTMVVKPAAETPLSMLALASILAEAGLPDGVLNVVPTTSARGVSEPLIRDPRLRKLSFTGSTQVGRMLIEQSAEQVLRTSMELGGNAPFLVFEDADLDAAVDGAVLAKMRNVGEACTAANRFHVHESIADDFTERLAARLSRLRVGRGTEEGVDVGPLINAQQRETVESLVSDAVERGGHVATGGSRTGDSGYFFEPTVLGNVPRDARILTEEVFGPVAPIATFGSDDDALVQANNTEYGLVSYVYTRDLQRALRVCEGLETGMVGLNAGIVSNVAAPFGGVKASGIGREGGFEGIEEFLETKYVSVALP